MVANINCLNIGSNDVVCCLHVTTAGQQGPNLGTDETQIVLLGYVLIDVNLNKVLGCQEYVILPDSTGVAGDPNSNFLLSDQTLQETDLNLTILRTQGITLEKAIQQFDVYLNKQMAIPDPLFVTDGQAPLRQALHPEALRRNVELPTIYTKFADLRKDVSRFYGNTDVLSSISEMGHYLDIPHTGEIEFHANELRDMINITQKLISDGYKFKIYETINLVLEPGICWKDEEVDDDCVVRARGLPWQSNDQDIAKFFRGLNLAKGGVALCLSLMGRRNGEALVRFTCKEHRDMALNRHKHHIDKRYIEVYRASGDDFVAVAGGKNNEAQQFLTRGAQVIIRMRGLPYDCTAKQVLEFFESGENSCSVMDNEEGVLFVKRADGRATGDAFVLFSEESDAPKALLKHRESIGTRYIELFRSTTAEVQQVLNRTMENGNSEKALATVAAEANYRYRQAFLQASTLNCPAQAAPAQPPPPPQGVFLPQLPLLPQHIITSGTRKDCIRLRGLPYEAQVEHILDFLGEYAKHIIFQGVHMVYNSQGQPSGEAFIQMDTEASAFSAAAARHRGFIQFGKKLRYIEVFQCSGEDMNQVLTGGLLPTAGQLSPPSTKSPLVSQSQSAGTLLTPLISAQLLRAGLLPPPGSFHSPATHPHQHAFISTSPNPTGPPPPPHGHPSHHHHFVFYPSPPVSPPITPYSQTAHGPPSTPITPFSLTPDGTLYLVDPVIHPHFQTMSFDYMNHLRSVQLQSVQP